jgi:hypothetical protein
VGNTKETETSFSFSFKITLHASKLKKDLAQSNLVGLRSEEIKKILPNNMNWVLGQFPSGAKNIAHSLILSAELFLV